VHQTSVALMLDRPPAGRRKAAQAVGGRTSYALPSLPDTTVIRSGGAGKTGKRAALHILNAIFLGVVRAGGKGQVGGGDRLETSIVVHGSPVAFRLTAVVPETKKSKRGASLAINQADRLRLSILDVHGSKPERFAWEDGEPPSSADSNTAIRKPPEISGRKTSRFAGRLS
jgi:hypothetical protein